MPWKSAWRNKKRPECSTQRAVKIVALTFVSSGGCEQRHHYTNTQLWSLLVQYKEEKS